MARWLFWGLVESVVIFFPLFAAVDELTQTGETPGIWMLGDYATIYVILIVSGKLLLESYQVTLAQHGALVFFVLLWWFMSYTANMLWVFESSFFSALADGYLGVWANTQGTPVYWLLILWYPVALILPQYAAMAYWRIPEPAFRDLVREAVYHGLDKATYFPGTTEVRTGGLDLLQKYRIPAHERAMRLRSDVQRKSVRATVSASHPAARPASQSAA